MTNLDVREDLAALRRLIGPTTDDGHLAVPRDDEPTSLHEQVRPHSWDDYVGQDATKRLLRISVAASLAGGRPLGHVFLYGPSGSGKTTLARLVTEELGARLAEVTKPVVGSDLARVLWDADVGEDTPAVLFVDEVHLWGRKQDALLQLMEEGFVDVRFDRFHFRHLTVIAATTERHEIRPALLERFSMRPVFEPYTDDELAAIVAGMAARLDIELDEDTCQALGAASAGVPRQARHLVEMARNIRDAGMDPTADDVFAITGIAPDGLVPDHLRYLGVLAACNGRAGLETLETRLDMHAKDLRRLERLLADRQFIGRDTRGRFLTTAGRNRLRQSIEGARPC